MNDDLDWLVHHRSEIQLFLLDLHRALPTADPASQPVLLHQLLLATGFSLWRAAFLAEHARTYQEANSNAKLFLEKVIRDNAIAYAQERETKAWTVGYYLNNAYLRLQLAYNLLTLETPLRKSVNAFVASQTTGGPSSADPTTPWKVALDAARELLASSGGT